MKVTGYHVRFYIWQQIDDPVASMVPINLFFVCHAGLESRAVLLLTVIVSVKDVD